MRILAIDPGNEKSAYVLYVNDNIKEFGIYSNQDMLSIVRTTSADSLAIEMVASYGMAVGKTVFETCVWIGRFVEAYIDYQKKPFKYIYRKDVKMFLCNSMKAKDANVRQSIMDRYGSTREAAIGTKKNPKALYGISKDIWSALAVAITASKEFHGQ
jgi:hypothetical protein